jgi:hypothetical protein
MKNQPDSSLDPEAVFRERVLVRAKAITGEFLNRLAIAHDDLEAGHHRAALGALDGAETMIQNLRSLLRLLEL